MTTIFLPPEEGFLGDRRAQDMALPLVRVIPFGLEATVSYGAGTAHGPAAMLTASQTLPLFDDESWSTPREAFRLETIKEPQIATPVEAALDQLAGLTGAALDEGAFPLVFGGEHAITPGALRPFVKRWPELTLLHFDAHADLRDGYDGQHFSHAAALRRCLDHEGVSLISIGIRNISAEEIPFYEANRHRIHIHWAKDKSDWRVEDIIAPLVGKHVYVTFDLDGFDASVMAATGTPEPGGFFWV
ncbi:MAG: arginase family protein, partial [Pseudomonadota bacterium]